MFKLTMPTKDAMRYMIEHPKTRMYFLGVPQNPDWSDPPRTFMFDGVLTLLDNGGTPLTPLTKLTGYAFYEMIMVGDVEVQYPRTSLPLGSYTLEIPVL